MITLTIWIFVGIRFIKADECPSLCGNFQEDAEIKDTNTTTTPDPIEEKVLVLPYKDIS